MQACGLGEHVRVEWGGTSPRDGGYPRHPFGCSAAPEPPTAIFSPVDGPDLRRRPVGRLGDERRRAPAGSPWSATTTTYLARLRSIWLTKRRPAPASEGGPARRPHPLLARVADPARPRRTPPAAPRPSRSAARPRPPPSLTLRTPPPGARLGPGMGLGLGARPGTAEIGYLDRPASATAAVPSRPPRSGPACHWAFTTFGHRAHRVALRGRQTRFPPGRREKPGFLIEATLRKAAHPTAASGSTGLGRLHAQHRNSPGWPG